MLQLRSRLVVADNTGAKKVYIIGIPKKGNLKRASIGNVVTAVVLDADPFGQVKKGDIVSALIVRTKHAKRRPDGSYIRFDDNACVILQSKDSMEPKGTRLFGPIAREIRDLKFMKIASMASELY